MRNDLSLVDEGCHLCGEEWIFQSDIATIHNASITKKYLLEQKDIVTIQHALHSSILSKICGD